MLVETSSWTLTMIRRIANKTRRKIFEGLGLSRYSRPSINNIDKQLAKYISYRNGFFIEVGANNGFSQSNTYYLERFLNWSGVLIEPIPELYDQCVKERKKAKVFNCALVDKNYKETHITMTYANLMSITNGAFENQERAKAHVEKGCNLQKVSSYEIQVPAKTLTSILDKLSLDKIDFFSLDVEGFELNVLNGLDFDKYCPRYLLIETSFRDDVDQLLSKWYIQVDQFSHHDFFYKHKESSSTLKPQQVSSLI
ncbi:MAG: FkbM family methyltransferase [Chloroflexaceae bacterium]|nr:FkbM family methyltransferase [Chloroflexaceae bacterium]